MSPEPVRKSPRTRTAQPEPTEQEARQAFALIQEGQLAKARKSLEEMLVRAREPALRELLGKLRKVAVAPNREVRPNKVEVITLAVLAVLAVCATMTPVIRLNPYQGITLAVVLAGAALFLRERSTVMDASGLRIHRLLSRKSFEWARLDAVEVGVAKVLVNGAHVENEVTVVVRLRDGGKVSFSGTDKLDACQTYEDFARSLKDYVELRNGLEQSFAGPGA